MIICEQLVFFIMSTLNQLISPTSYIEKVSYYLNASLSVSISSSSSYDFHLKLWQMVF